MTGIDDFTKELRERDFNLSKADIKYANESPEAKAAGVRIVPTKKDKFKNWLLVILIGFLIVSGIAVYMMYKGKLQPISNLMCGNVTCEKTECQACQECSPCVCSVNQSCSFPSTLNINLRNSS
jgi:hypothetical protein